MAQRETRARLHETGVALGDRDRDAGRHERPPAAGFEPGVGARGEVVARVAGVLARRQRDVGIEAANADVRCMRGG